MSLYYHQNSKNSCRLHSSSSSSSSIRQTAPVEYALTYINSPYTKSQYKSKLKLFFDFLHLPGNSLEEQGQAFLAQARSNEYWAEDSIRLFLDFHKQRVLIKKEIAAGTVGTFYRPIKTFCDAHERDFLLLPNNRIDWKRISKALPRAKSYSNDRAPKVEEIRKLVEYPDRRIKPLVFVMCSSGIRVGAWKYLRWKHVTPIKDEKTDEIIAAKLIVYADEHDQYYTFMTPEAYNALKEWMDYRTLHGETITGESWLMRDKWRTVDVKSEIGEDDKKCGRVGLVTIPQPLSYEGIKKVLSRALWDQGLRHVLSEGVRRHEWKGAHGYRKFYKSRAEQVMKPINVETTMGHSTGISHSYYKPTEHELLEDYLKAVDLLTINDINKPTLQKQVAELQERNKEESNLIIGKLAEKEREAEDTKKRLADLEQRFEQLIQFNQRRAVSHELELRRLKGEGNNAPLSKEDVEDILRWEEYHDYLDEEYAE